jgi:hypothetical protein
MSDKHETDIAAALGGRKNRGSGNQWANPIDGRQNRYRRRFAWAWDCKATFQKSASITREMLKKLRDQAEGERPALPIRFYDNERLTSHDDWVLIRMEDFMELNDVAWMYEQLNK